MTYSTDSNVTEKISHVQLPDKLVVANFREESYNYINMRLRSLYKIPVSGSLEDQTYLKFVEANISAGKILLAVGTVNSANEVSEYGKMLIAAGEKAIDLVAGSTDGKKGASIVLSGADLDTDKSDQSADFPNMGLASPDSSSTFNRPMSGIENDALLGKTDATPFNSIEDTLTP